jgi:hypothetical protein
MVYMGDRMETRLVVVHDKTNGRWELRSSIKTQWTKGHGTFGAHEERGQLRTHAPPSKTLPIATW